MSMRKELKDKAQEAIKKFPERKADILDIVAMAFEAIGEGGSENLEYEMAIDYIQNIIDGKELT